ncbi:MAG: hypothetical protein IH598_04740 [Bacteroidales bacterium]|nr:hypothetical protein [Bacteroidales bacterium]
MDFTIKQYQQLLKSLQHAGFFFQTFKEYLQDPMQDKAIILRHDVDLLPQNSLQFAQIQHDFGVKGSYYFRAVPESWDEKVIKEIHALGHEVGYHYENLTTCKGNLEQALEDFKSNLGQLRNLVPVNTICMHGSPRSPYDSKDLWKSYDYRSFGIIGEPYFDINFNKFFYLTDTGRQWDGWRVSVRDKMSQQDNWVKQGLVFHSTNDIINAANKGNLPDKIMMTFHPQRWSDKPLPWIKELLWQGVKNVGKRVLIQIKKG